jgi:hypothetical protein
MTCGVGRWKIVVRSFSERLATSVSRCRCDQVGTPTRRTTILDLRGFLTGGGSGFAMDVHAAKQNIVKCFWLASLALCNIRQSQPRLAVC